MFPVHWTPPVLKSHLKPCPLCGVKDLPRHISLLGRCLECAQRDLATLDQWEAAYQSCEEERSYLRNTVVPHMEEVIRRRDDNIAQLIEQLHHHETPK